MSISLLFFSNRIFSYFFFIIVPLLVCLETKSRHFSHCRIQTLCVSIESFFFSATEMKLTILVCKSFYVWANLIVGIWLNNRAIRIVHIENPHSNDNKRIHDNWPNHRVQLLCWYLWNFWHPMNLLHCYKREICLKLWSKWQWLSVAFDNY